MGLFDSLSPDQMGLLYAGLGMMSNSVGPNARGAIGQGGLMGLQAYQQAKAMQQDQAMQAQQKAAIEGMLGNIQDPREKAFAQAFPKEWAASQMRQEQVKPQLVDVMTPNGPVQRWVKPGEATGVDVGAPVSKEAALPWYIQRGQDGKTVIDPAYAEFEKQKAMFARPPAQPMAPVAYQDPVTKQVVWGTITDARGKPAANFSPSIQGSIAGAKEGAKVAAEDAAKSAIDAPRVIDNADTAIRLSNELLKHPGMPMAVGTSSILGIQHIPGTQAKDFMNRLDQVKGGAFLEAFNSLKGGGQITEVEGKKATDAIARMDNATSEEAFRAAVKDYQDIIRRGVNRVKMKAKPVAPVSIEQPGAVQSPGIDDLLKKYGGQ